VKDEMPTSYLLAARPGMIASNVAFWTSTSSPSFSPSALIRSMSMPMIVLPSLSTNSFGA